AQESSADEEIVDAMTCLDANSWDIGTSNSFYPFRFEISMLGNILLRGTRLIIPKSLRKRVLELAHEGHPGESAMKRHNDCIQKHKGKVVADKKRGAKEVSIQVGDQVLMKNVVFPNKLTPNFNTTIYEVLEREGNIVKVSGGGKTLIRDASHLKKIPAVSTRKDVTDLGSTTTDLEKTRQHPLQDTPEPTRSASPGPGLKLKLINKGGMWEPVRESVGSDSLLTTGRGDGSS
ncbi:hypothetical protein KR084_011135, partial [Drosophila pseudotakahashii]